MLKDGKAVVGGYITPWITSHYRYLKHADGTMVVGYTDSSGYYSIPWVAWDQDGVLLGTHTFQTIEQNYVVWSNTQSMTILDLKYLLIYADGPGTTNPAPGSYSYTTGTSVTIYALPNPGATLYEWAVDGVVKPASSSITVTMDTFHTVEARFTTAPTPTSFFVDAIGGTAGFSAPYSVRPNESFNVSGYLGYQSDTVWTPLAGATISFYVDGAFIRNLTTDSSGYFSTTHSIGTLGVHTLEVRYAGT